MGTRFKDAEGAKVNCTVCGANLKSVVSDLPFKTDDRAIVIVKGLPLLQCVNCTEFLIEDAVMSRIDEILASVSTTAELEVVRYAA